MSTELNKKVARQLVEEILSQGNMLLVDDLLAPDFIEHEELPPGIPRSSEGFALMLTMMRSAFPDFNAKVEDIIAEAEKVVVRMTWTGTQHGEFMGIPPGGKSFSIGVIDIFRMAGGRIAEHWGLTDSMAMMQQLEATSAPE